jgi:hypothetical protein
MQKLELKSVYKFCKSGSSSHTKHSKIGFAIFGFVYDFIRNLQVIGKSQREKKNHLSQGSLERFGLHKTTLTSNS